MAACTAIVVGNMVGSGFYLSPAAVAPYGNLAILVWIVMGAGAICLGLTFARLARLAPADRRALCLHPSRLWRLRRLSHRLGLLDLDLGVAAGHRRRACRRGGRPVPAAAERAIVVVLTLGAIWVVVLVNLRGVKAAGLMAEVTTYAKLVPFGAVAMIGLLYIDASHFGEFNPSGVPLLQATAALAPLTMFAFLGLESATVPAGDVRDPGAHDSPFDGARDHDRREPSMCSERSS